MQSVKNERLAARLTGYKIDIKSETQAIESGELPENYMELSEGVFEEEVEDGYEEEEIADVDMDLDLVEETEKPEEISETEE